MRGDWRWMMVLMGLAACKGEQLSSSRVLATEGTETISIAARSLDDTSIKWAARAVGVVSERGMVLSLTVGDRPSVVLEKLSDAETAPSQSEVDAAVARVVVQLSPDGQHLLVSWDLKQATRTLFHLLPKGPPFALAIAGAQAPASGAVDWSRIAASQQLAHKALEAAAVDPANCRRVGQDLFWEALQDAAPGTALEEPLLALWPACIEARLLVANISRNRKDVSVTWKANVKSKLDAVLASKASAKDLHVVLDLCLFIEDEVCVAAVAPRLMPLWPEDPDAHEVAMQSFDKLPKATQQDLVNKAMDTDAAFSFEGKARMYRLMKTWTDCPTFQVFASTHLDVVQKRDDCQGWPLDRFPSDGLALEQVKALLAGGKRNEAIRLVRQTTGWDYAKAVDLIKTHAGSQ